jgi:hypothetical protein
LLQKFHYFLRDSFRVPFPTTAGPMMHLGDVAAEISHRLSRPFRRDADRRRPVFGGAAMFQTDPHWRDLLLFYDCFHGDNGAGIGSFAPDGLDGPVTKLLQQSGE